MAKNSSKTAASVGTKFTNPYDMFQTDKSKEAEGIVLNYSDVFWIKSSRAGGAPSLLSQAILNAASAEPSPEPWILETQFLSASVRPTLGSKVR